MSGSDTFENDADRILSSFRDDAIVRFWTESDLLAQLRQKNKGRQKQVIHDIPRPPAQTTTPRDVAPRILKDIYFKAAALMGFNVAYVPSWNLFDPAVEADVAQAEHRCRHALDPIQLRRQCKQRIAKRMEHDKAILQRLGIFADWRGVRPHMESRYEARLLDGFGQLMSRGYLTKEAKPSYWCVNCQTILTRDELKLKPRKSAAAYVRFPVRQGLERLGTDVSLMVWVVELWALPAGIAVALPRSGQYVAIDYEGHTLIIEEETAAKVFDGEFHPIRETLNASELLQCTCSHPLLNVELPVVQSEVDGKTRKGTGLFLAVPGHNQDDYAVRLEHNYKIVSIIDDEGRLTEDAEGFCGLSVFDASEHIALQLDAMGFLMSTDMIESPYPHCWTCESPAVFRPADQWLFDPEKHNLARRTLQELESVDLNGGDTATVLRTAIEERSKWGASRQRVWGLPVPAFYCQKCGTQLEVDRAVKAVRDFISHKGTDAWFRAKADTILSNDVHCAACEAREFRKDTSILDPKMVTLLTSLLQMEGRRETAAIGDLYIEQTEDARDWLAQMLLTLYATKEHFPTQFFHFVDARDQLPPKEILEREALMELLEEEQGGADLLRLLVVLEGVDTKTSNKVIVNRLRDRYEAIQGTLLRLVHLATSGSRSGRVSAQVPTVFGLFADHLASKGLEIVAAYRRYDFLEAWNLLEALRLDLDDCTTIAAHLIDEGILSKERTARLRGLLYDWTIRYLKLVTPYVPMFAEHVWRTGLGCPEGESIFLSEWPFPVDVPAIGSSSTVSISAPSFSMWRAIAAELSKRKGRKKSLTLLVDTPELVDYLRDSEAPFEALLRVPVRVITPSDVIGKKPRITLQTSELFETVEEQAS